MAIEQLGTPSGLPRLLVAASTSSKRALSGRHLAESITTMITDSLPHTTERFTTRAPLSHPGSH